MGKTTARVGAAVFALGVSLSGPQGLAVADTGDGDSPAASAGNGDSHQRNVAAGQSRPSANTPGVRGTRTARSAPQPAAAEDVRPGGVKAVSGRDPGSKRRVTVDPVVPEAAATRAETGVQIPVRSAVATPRPGGAVAGGATVAAAEVTGVATPVAASAVGSPVAVKAQVPAATQVVTAIVRVARALDGAGDWLSGLPDGPVTDLLSGALLLVRRTLFPKVPTIPKVSVSNPVVDEDINEAVFTVTLDKAYSSTVTVGFSTDSSPSHPWTEPAELAARATAGVDYQTATGFLTFEPGQTSKHVIIVASDDQDSEVSETFDLEVFATWTRGDPSSAAAGRASAIAPDVMTSVRLASGTATIIDDDRVKIDVNPNFAYGDALLASVFSDLAYNHRNDADFSALVEATGWEGIGISGPALGPDGYSPSAGGFGVRDGWSMQSYAFAGKRIAADGTAQFIVAFEGSNMPWQEPADWVVNASQYGWSRYYASLEPLMSEVVGQLLSAQNEQQKTQLIITGHSLGGASAMMAFADLLAPQGNLWPDTGDVLRAGQRVLDDVGGWSPEIRTALLAATSVYTFGAPSILIEPVKPGTVEATAFAVLAAGSGFLAALALLPTTIGAMIVDDKKLPDLTGIAGINFGTRVFQFEHANTSWLPPYPGDIVAQLGSRDPGTVLQVNLDNDVHASYTSLLTRFVPGGTHPMGGYRESLVRLVGNERLLKNPNKLSGDSPQLTPTGAGSGSDARNDFFVNSSDAGRNGNDLFVFSKAGSYAADGGQGSDAYSISGYDVSLLIDGSLQSGRDTVVFDLPGDPGERYFSTDSSTDTAVFSVTGAGGKSSSVTITHWDKWQVSDIFQVIKPAEGHWTLDAWTDIQRGPVVAATPAEVIPLSVL